MKQAIAGVVPPELEEVDIMTVWPTIGAIKAGRLVGWLAARPIGLGSFFTLGTLLAVATIPISLAVFAWQLLPFVCLRYTVTNRRIIVKKGLSAVDTLWIDLDGFDAVDVEILDGQEWLHAGELVFRRERAEVFRFWGVSRPEVFRQVCLKSQDALISVRKIRQHQEANSEQPAVS